MGSTSDSFGTIIAESENSYKKYFHHVQIHAILSLNKQITKEKVIP